VQLKLPALLLPNKRTRHCTVYMVFVDSQEVTGLDCEPAFVLIKWSFPLNPQYNLIRQAIE